MDLHIKTFYSIVVQSRDLQGYERAQLMAAVPAPYLQLPSIGVIIEQQCTITTSTLKRSRPFAIISIVYNNLNYDWQNTIKSANMNTCCFNNKVHFSLRGKAPPTDKADKIGTDSFLCLLIFLAVAKKTK